MAAPPAAGHPTEPMHTSTAPQSGIRSETLAALAAYWKDRSLPLAWPGPFSLPSWLGAWWSSFASGWRPVIRSVHHRGQVAGIAPLMRRGREVRLIGDAEVCDHLDFVVAPRQADVFYQHLLDHLAEEGVQRMVLQPVREDASVVTRLLPAAEKRGLRIRCDPGSELFAMALPATWEDYLMGLQGKMRHEIRRKLRRLEEAGRVDLRCIRAPAAVPAAMAVFIRLFRANAPAKAAFMTGPMPSYFRRLADRLAADGLLRLFIMDLDGRPIAATLCVEYRSTVYLYNNGYDGAFSPLSAGLLSKVLTIQDSIRRGCRGYDFLKGAEPYKRRLGGRPVGVRKCVVALT
jgi:CelD/BcsL family acetyltransferase involved in cellulose biosynthesis